MTVQKVVLEAGWWDRYYKKPCGRKDKGQKSGEGGVVPFDLLIPRTKMMLKKSYLSQIEAESHFEMFDCHAVDDDVV